MDEKTIQLPKIIKTYLDGLNDEQRDRVIAAEAFKVGGGYRPGQKGGLRDIVKVRQQAMDMDFTPGAMLKTVVIGQEVPDSPNVGCLIDHATAGTSTAGYSTVGSAFDTFYRAHGAAAIREIKTYAARLNRIELPVEYETETWTREEVPA